jgi:2-keto-4-pentenoate hydratase/2-oxohepta-3-ene-1,7-dioic acid hydratase in catechol pathway
VRLVSVRREEGLRLGGVLRGAGEERVLDLNAADPSIPADLRAFLEAGDLAWKRASDLLGSSLRTGASRARLPADAIVPLAGARLGPVVPNPSKIVCIGLNYRDHAEETGQALPEVPTVFAKYPNVLIGAGEPIVAPRASDQVDYEAELAFVIGRRARHVDEEHAAEHVAGYTIFNDVTARDVQRRTPQWTLGKSFDTFGPLGPALVTSDEVPDPQALAIRLSVDGEVLQSSSTAGMIFPVPRLVAHLSAVMTLEPGDVVSTGTPAGVGFVRRPPRFLRPGQTVRIEIEGLGVLENPVVREGEPAGPRAVED